MPKTTMLLCLLFLLVSMPVFTHAAEESHPSLKQLIAESKEQNRRQHWSMTTDVHFEPTEVRKKFFGNETAFLQSLH